MKRFLAASFLVLSLTSFSGVASASTMCESMANFLSNNTTGPGWIYRAISVNYMNHCMN